MGTLQLAHLQLAKDPLLSEFLGRNFVLAGGAIFDVATHKTPTDYDLYYYMPKYCKDEVSELLVQIGDIFRRANVEVEYFDIHTPDLKNIVHRYKTPDGTTYEFFFHYQNREQRIGSADIQLTTIAISSQGLDVTPLAMLEFNSNAIVVDIGLLRSRRYIQRLLKYFNEKKFGLLFQVQFSFESFGFQMRGARKIDMLQWCADSLTNDRVSDDYLEYS
jgi:hypothetical protein